MAKIKTLCNPYSNITTDENYIILRNELKFSTTRP